MKVFHIIMNFVKALLLKIFPSLGYEGVINTQIGVYNKLKRGAPQMPENDLLNRLIISRIEALPRVAPKEEEYAYYTPLLENPDKTLEDVVWAIVEYEYFLSREEQVFKQLSQMGLSQPEILAVIDDQMAKPRRYIKESINKKVKNAILKLDAKETRTKEQYQKIWYDILRKSKEFSKDVAEKFFIADNIDPFKFKENHDYYVMDRYGDHKPTPSCFHPLDAPIAYPYWFASAYPDVVKYFSAIEDEDLMKVFEYIGFTKRDSNDIDSKSFDQEGHFTLEVLYKLKEHYKKLHPDVKLECQ